MSAVDFVCVFAGHETVRYMSFHPKPTQEEGRSLPRLLSAAAGAAADLVLGAVVRVFREGGPKTSAQNQRVLTAADFANVVRVENPCMRSSATSFFHSNRCYFVYVTPRHVYWSSLYYSARPRMTMRSVVALKRASHDKSRMMSEL